jgi:hypothetical protein
MNGDGCICKDMVRFANSRFLKLIRTEGPKVKTVLLNTRADELPLLRWNLTVYEYHYNGSQ